MPAPLTHTRNQLSHQDDTDTEIPASETEAYYDHLIAGLRHRGVTTLISTLCGLWSGEGALAGATRRLRGRQ